LKALRAQNIFFSPLQKNIAIVEKDLESEESDGQEMDELYLESCAKCGEISMNIEVIEEHTRKFVGKHSNIETEKVNHQEQLPAVLNANGLKKMLTHRSKFFTAIDEMTFANRKEFGETLTMRFVCRNVLSLCKFFC
jgi:hypothetical protein